MSAKLDITEETLRANGFRPLVAGDDYPMGFTAEVNGVAINLAGAKLWFTVKDNSQLTDAEAKLQMDSDTGDIQIDDPANGHFIVNFHATATPSTADLEGQWIYDIQALLSSGKVVTISGGIIEFLRNITRTTS
jgi:hypothetical protein